ncbi:MAG: ABC transporter substrate-binding protein [Bdellovibrionales bacterium]
MKLGQILLVIVLSVAATLVTTRIADNSPQQNEGIKQPVVKQTRLEQVKNSGVLRCGYFIWPPFNTKDPNTGKMSGLYYDLVEEIGQQLDIKIEWAGEVSTGQMLADLASNRYDMICSPLGLTPGRAREGDFTTPFLYTPVYLYVRKDDTRFDNNFERANQPDITLAIMDGELSGIAANENFPSAKQTTILQLLNSADLFMAVANKKADAVVQDPFSFETYDKNNPGILRPTGNTPLRMLAAGMPLPANEPALKAMIDTTINYLIDSGYVDKLFRKYEGNFKYFRAAKHYQE